MTDQHAAATYLPPAKYTRSDGAITCPHGTPVAPGSCDYCWELHQAGCEPCWEKHLAAVRADVPRVTPNPDGGVILHLPQFMSLDTQVWSVDIGLTDNALAALRDVLNELPDGGQP